MVLALLAEPALARQHRYGRLDLRRDPTEFRREAAELVEVVPCVAVELARQTRRGEIVGEGGTHREYLYAEQLAAITPWSPDAIDSLVRRGVLRPDVHFFQPGGRRSRRIFKWRAIVDLIEHPSRPGRGDVLDQQQGKDALRAEEATQRLRRLLR